VTWITAWNQTEFQNRLKPTGTCLIYIAWQLGMAANQEIGEKFGPTYSAVAIG
jgi:hypothetical protein